MAIILYRQNNVTSTSVRLFGQNTVISPQMWWILYQFCVDQFKTGSKSAFICLYIERIIKHAGHPAHLVTVIYFIVYKNILQQKYFDVLCTLILNCNFFVLLCLNFVHQNAITSYCLCLRCQWYITSPCKNCDDCFGKIFTRIKMKHCLKKCYGLWLYLESQQNSKLF